MGHQLSLLGSHTHCDDKTRQMFHFSGCAGTGCENSTKLCNFLFRQESVKISDSGENIQHSSPKTACNQSSAAARSTLENAVCATKLSHSQNRGEPSIFLPERHLTMKTGNYEAIEENAARKSISTLRKLTETELSRAKEMQQAKPSLTQNEKRKKEVALQIEMYGHIKSWLAPRMTTVSQSDIDILQNSIDIFQEAIAQLEASEDQEDILAFTTSCECMIEDCKKALPL